MGNRYEVARRQVEAAEIWLAQPPSTGRAIGTGRIAGRPDEAEMAAGVRAALETFRQLPAQADIPRAENLLARLNASLGAAGAVEQAVAVAHLRLQLPELSPGSAGEPPAGAPGAEAPAASGLERQEELANLFARLTAALEKIGRDCGALVATTGSGLAYLFSGPTPDLSDSLAQQAVQAGLDAIDASARLNRASRRQHGFEITLSIGLTAGRWTGGADSRQAAVFASASLPGRYASAAAAAAAPNQIAVTGEITQAIRSLYELALIEAAPPEARVLGPLFAVGRVRSATRLPQPLPSSSPALVGRAPQLAALTNWVDSLRRDNQGMVCYLEAEAGMGKTRLLDQVLAYAETDILCLMGKCESFRAGISYWALVDMLERAELPEGLAARSEQLQSLLGLRPADEADAQLLRNLPPAGLRQEIFARVRALLLQAAAQKPVMLIFEDIHWLDLSSLDLIDFLLPLTLEAPIAL
ncbi:MAG: AAA family ATPase, partial [Anaerolineales bacterium]